MSGYLLNSYILGGDIRSVSPSIESITKAATTTASTSQTTTTTHTHPASANKLFVFVRSVDNNTDISFSVTYNSVALTSLYSAISNVGAGNYRKIEVFVLDTPPVGTYTGLVNVTNGDGSAVQTHIMYVSVANAGAYGDFVQLADYDGTTGPWQTNLTIPSDPESLVVRYTTWRNSAADITSSTITTIDDENIVDSQSGVVYSSRTALTYFTASAGTESNTVMTWDSNNGGVLTFGFTIKPLIISTGPYSYTALFDPLSLGRAKLAVPSSNINPEGWNQQTMDVVKSNGDVYAYSAYVVEEGYLGDQYYAFQNPAPAPRYGGKHLRLEVRPGDYVSGDTYSTVAFRQAVNGAEYNVTTWYGFSTYIPSFCGNNPWPTANSTIIWRLVADPNVFVGPWLSARVSAEGTWNLILNAQAEGASYDLNGFGVSNDYALEYDKWTDWAVEIKSNSINGFCNVYKDGVLIASYAGPFQNRDGTKVMTSGVMTLVFSINTFPPPYPMFAYFDQVRQIRASDGGSLAAVTPPSVEISTFGYTSSSVTPYDETYYVAESSTNGWRETSDLVTGWDWSYPPSTTVAELSGIFRFTNTMNYPVGFLGKKIYKIDAKWIDLEPSEGVYDLSILNLLDTIDSYWDGVQLDIKGSVKTSSDSSLITAPSWLDGRNIQEISNTINGISVTFYNVAHTEFNRAFRLLIDAISNYVTPGGYKVPTHPKLIGQVVHGGGTSSIEEEAGFGYLDDDADPDFFAETVQRWALKYKLPYQNADYSYKLAWVGQHQTENMPLHRIAIDAGMGTRGEAMELWLQGLKTPRQGGVYTAQNVELYKNSSGVAQPSDFYLIQDTTDPRIINRRWFGDQNESYGLNNVGSFGSINTWQMRYRMSNLRTVQMKLNNTALEPLNTTFYTDPQLDGREGYLNPALYRWLGVSLGKRLYSSSEPANTEATEAWCCFMKGNSRSYFDPILPVGEVGGTYTNPVDSGSFGFGSIHNLEYFLTQREVDGSTAVSLPVDWGYNPAGTESQLDTYPELRQGWVARTGSSIGLKLDNSMRLNGAVAIKVTFFDNNSNTWQLRYTTATGTSDLTHTNTNTNRVKTKTWFVNDFQNTANVVNIRLLDNAATTPFMFVRVIRISGVIVDTQAPTVPANLVATAQSTSQINLTWAASTDNVAVAEYRIRRSTDNSTWTVIATGLTATSYQDTGLQPLTTYYYQVRAIDTSNNFSSWSGSVQVSTPAAELGYQFPPGDLIPSTATLTAIPTFHSVGLYWNEPTGSGDTFNSVFGVSETNEALVRFRKTGTQEWRQGLSLWFDNRTTTWLNFGSKEYRGSLVELDPDTEYDVQVLTRNSRRLASTTFRTWSEDFSISQTITVPSRTTTYNVTTSGTATSYVLYDFSGSTIDGNNLIQDGIYVNASNVIIRGATIREVLRWGINLAPNCQNVIIEQCDISKYGKQDANDPGFAENHCGAIGTSEFQNPNMTKIIIQNNLLHDPTWDANSWSEPRTDWEPGSSQTHPQGAQGISLWNTKGNHVIRYNRIYSTLDKMHNDGIGGGGNFSKTNGNVTKDSDIYGNWVSHCWDDGLEIEGVNQNIRIWNNLIEYCFQSLALAHTNNGPVYVWRNVTTRGVTSPTELNGYGNFLKIRSNTSTETGAGRIYLLHNTLYFTQSDYSNAGADGIRGLLNIGDADDIWNVHARNNVLYTRNGVSTTVLPAPWANANWNYDVYYNQAPNGQNLEETNGIFAVPIFDSAASSGPYTLSTSSRGYNEAVLLPNFNDLYTSPDMGAQERNATRIIFGPRTTFNLPVVLLDFEIGQLSAEPIVIPPLTVSVSPSSINIADTTSTITSSSITASASGGTPNYSFAWSKVSGDNITANSLSSASTTFTASGLVEGETRTAIFRCTVTDSGSPSQTASVTATVTIQRQTTSTTIVETANTTKGVNTNTNDPGWDRYSLADWRTVDDVVDGWDWSYPPSRLL